MDDVTLIRILVGCLVLVLCLLYFYPTFKAMGKRNTGAIFALNLLTGWSTIGWVVALIWALKNDAVALRPDEVQQFTVRDRRIKGFIYMLWSVAFLVLVVLFFTKLSNEHSNETNLPTSSAVYFVPNATARGVSVVSGAIVCPDHETVTLMFNQYVAQWEDKMQDAVTNGQSHLIRGQSAPAPDLESYGCALLPSGTPVMLDTGNVVPLVTAKLPNGTIIKGVTLPAMIVQNQQQFETANQQIQGSNSPTDMPAAPQEATQPVEASKLSAAEPTTASATPPEPQGETASGKVDTGVSRALDNWANANESNDPALLANCYAAQVDRYFLRQNVTNTFVHDYQEAWLRDHDSRVTMFRIKDVTFENETAENVQLRLVKEVVTTDSKGVAERFIPSELSLKKVAGDWKITSERDFK